MNPQEKLEILQRLDEKTLTKKFIIPLYQSSGMGCKNVQYTHKILEFGKDIIYYKDDEHENRIYTGIQVKAVKITTGKSDALLRQIFEAFGESFTDLGDGKEKEIDKIVLLTSYEFTEEAKESLRAALKGAHLDRLVTFVDGNKLVYLLDKHLPSALWDQYEYFNRYFHAMKSDFEIIEDISAIGQRDPVVLEEIYVSLKLSEKPGRDLHEKMDTWETEEPREEHIFDADDVVKKFKKVVIVGAPGSGKTTLLKHVTLKCCKENLEKHARITVPIFITLRQFSESGKNLREYINDVFEQYNFPKAGEFIEEDLEDGKCQLLFDGFDELATTKRQHTVTKDIEDFIRLYHKNQFIVTSRIAGYHDELKGFEKLQVQEFDDHQIEQFITNWFGKADAETARIMNKTIKINEKIRAIARNPLMASIIALVCEEEQELPQRKVELYECCVEVLLERWDVIRKIKNTYDEKAKEKILRKLALEAHISKKRSFPREELLKKFYEYLPEVRIKPEEAEDVLDEIVQRNVLLKEISRDVYSFLHLSFQEYLAAFELRERMDHETLLQYLYDPWWEEVVLLFAGFDRDATELITQIRKKEREDEQYKEDIFYSNLMLMGKCIADADYTGVEMRTQIVEDLWSLYQTAAFSSLREKAIGVLALIEPDTIIDSLLKELKAENSHVRRGAAEALGKIKSEKAVDSLIEALNDEKSHVRRGAAEALGKIKSEKAVDSLIEALKDEKSHVRGSAAYALGELKSEKAVDSLIEALKDEKSHVRGSAALALGKIGNEKALEPLINTLNDKEGRVRGNAALALGKIGNEKAVDSLIEALRDEERYVRWGTACAIGELKSEKAVEPLINALNDKKDYIRWSAAYALGELKSEKAVNPLIEALNDEEGYVRGCAAYALGEIRSEKAVNLLIKALKDKISYVREMAALALGKIGNEKAVDSLIEALNDEEGYVRGNAALALGKITSEKAVKPLKSALEDEGECTGRKVKDCAFDSLEKISKRIKKKILYV